MTDYVMGLITGTAIAYTAIVEARAWWERRQPLEDPPVWVNGEREAA